MAARRIAALALLCAASVGVAACGGSDDDQKTVGTVQAGAPKGGKINGAGATFPQPVYSAWGARYKKATGTVVDYAGVGSGAGIAEFTDVTVDFGATDAFMTNREIAAARRKGGRTLHIPTVAGAVTIAYNLPGVGSGLRLDGPTIAKIFLGRITRWDDQAIREQNRSVRLPESDIVVCHRNDSSGTTKLFTSFLADSYPPWDREVGTDKLVKWPTGTGAKGNSGVAACIKQDEGAVGYVEQAYALENGLTTADVRNATGHYIKPTLESTTAALQRVPVPADLRFTTIDTPAPFGYPIATVTFIVVYQDMCKAGIAPAAAQRVKSFLDYAEAGGQLVAPQLSFAPLTPKIGAAAKEKVASLLCNGKPLA
jgi:phosphate transport system substrate-binding protein